MRSTFAALSLIALTVPALGRPQNQSAPAKPEKSDTGDVVGGIAGQPLEDVNIKRKRIPEVLELARGDPYSVAGLRNCGIINTRISELTKVLGTDFDAPEDRQRRLTAEGVGRSVVQSFIPFRGVIREVTGAAATQREWDAAVDAGIARRGFLRGTARARGCRVPQ